MEERLKAGLWVSAAVRLCSQQGIGAFVTKRGDEDAGIIFIKLNRLGLGFEILSQTRTETGEPAWTRPLGPDPLEECKVDDYLTRQQRYDPDLWIIEVEDRDGRLPMCEKVV